MNLDLAIEKIDKIKSEIDLAFERGSIDFDLIDSELTALRDELKSAITARIEELPQEIIPSSDNKSRAEFISSNTARLEDFR